MHQLDHFQDELLSIADAMIAETEKKTTDFKYSLVGRYHPAHHKTSGTVGATSSTSPDPDRNSITPRVEVDGELAKLHTGVNVDRAWQALSAAQCLFDCIDSIDFAKHSNKV